MAYMCQGCSAEGEVWEGQCPSCGSRQYLNLAPKKADLLGQLVDGRYRIEGKLGQGGMGTVYKATREGMGQTVAIKVLNAEFSHEPEVVRRFLREAKSYGMVQHPNAVNLLDFGQLPDGALYICMEYIAGKDLSKTIQERQRMPIGDAIDITVQCCDVLGFAHEKGIIHRDLKPENIMLVKGLRSYHAKVLDFGIARLVSDNATQLTVAGTICGTPRYMSPEQARGKEVDVRSDIYSLGLVFFEMVTGRQAYQHSSITDLLRAQVTEPVPHVWEAANGLPESIDAVIQKACAKNRDDRFISMGQLADALSKAMPTLNAAPYDVSQPHLDPAAPGRTFLGPGANGGSSPGMNQPSIPPPVATNPNMGEGATYLRASNPNVEVAPAHGEAAIPVDLVAKSKTPAPSLENQQTMLKAGPATVPERKKSPSIPLADERPPEPSLPQPAKTPWAAIGGGVVVLGIIAAVAVPKLLAKPADDLKPVPNPPVAINNVPPPVAPTGATGVPAPTGAVTPTGAVAPTGAIAPTGAVAPTGAPAPTGTPAPTGVAAQDPHPGKTSGGTISHPKPTGTGGGENNTVKKINAAVDRSAVAEARSSFLRGDITVARAHIAGIDASSEYAESADQLLNDIKHAEELLGRAKRMQDTGDCGSAIKLWREALSLSPGLSAAKSGISRCEASAPPSTVE